MRTILYLKPLGIVVFISLIFVLIGELFANYRSKKRINFITPIKNQWWFGYLIASVILFALLVFLDIKYQMVQSAEKVENIIAELHGLFFDLILFGIVMTVYDRTRDKKEYIERLNEELDDYKYWKGQESTFRRIGIIRRLLKINNGKINLKDHDFHEGKFELIDFSRLVLSSMQFTKCGFDKCNLTGGKISNVSFINSTFNDIIFSCNPVVSDFIKSNFNKCKFPAIDLSGNNFENCNFRGCEFNDCELSFANFKNSIFYGTVSFSGCNIHKIKLDGVFFPELRRSELINKMNMWFGEEKTRENVLNKYSVVNLDDPPGHINIDIESIFPITGPRKYKPKQNGCFLSLIPKLENPFIGD